jgi:DNA-binding response OmpR family regulator
MSEQRQAQRKHIFAINGAADFLDFVRELLQEERYNVTTTNYVPNTYDQIAALDPDLLIMDLAVGSELGWELLERLHREAATQGIPVILVSTDPALLTRAGELPHFGQHRSIIKPFELDELLSAVEDLIGRA